MSNRIYYIYMHKNKITGEVYIGKSVNPKHRWGKNGSQYLHKKKNTNLFIQPKFANAILKYGWDNFEHIIIDKTESSYNSILLEIKYIDEYNAIDNGYNTMRGSSNYSSNYIENCRRRSKGENNNRSRQVVMKDFKSGKKLKLFNCANDIARELGYKTGRHIIDCCLKKREYACGFSWEYYDGEEFEDVEDYILYKTDTYINGNVPVLQYDLNGNFIQEFPSIKAAGIEVNSTAICQCLKGKRKTAAGFIWKYKDLKNNRGTYSIRREEWI